LPLKGVVYDDVGVDVYTTSVQDDWRQFCQKCRSLLWLRHSSRSGCCVLLCSATPVADVGNTAGESPVTTDDAAAWSQSTGTSHCHSDQQTGTQNCQNSTNSTSAVTPRPERHRWDADQAHSTYATTYCR